MLMYELCSHDLITITWQEDAMLRADVFVNIEIESEIPN